MARSLDVKRFATVIMNHDVQTFPVMVVMRH